MDDKTAIEQLEQRAKKLLADLDATQKAIFEAKDAEERARSDEAKKLEELEQLRLEMGVPAYNVAAEAYRELFPEHRARVARLDNAIVEAVKEIAVLKALEVRMKAHLKEAYALHDEYELNAECVAGSVDYPLPKPFVLSVRSESKTCYEPDKGHFNKTFHVMEWSAGRVIGDRIAALRKDPGKLKPGEVKGVFNEFVLELD